MFEFEGRGQGDAIALEKFMTDMIDKKGKLSEDYFEHKRTIVHEAEGATAEHWVPWKEAADKEGHDNLLEMIEAKIVPAIRHPKLPADSGNQIPIRPAGRDFEDEQDYEGPNVR